MLVVEDVRLDLDLQGNEISVRIREQQTELHSNKKMDGRDPAVTSTSSQLPTASLNKEIYILISAASQAQKLAMELTQTGILCPFTPSAQTAIYYII